MDRNKPPQSWPPNARDCSQGYCSYYCPQWCFFFFPPPPPPSPSRPLLSPLLISIIAITSTAFVLVVYYLILTRYWACQRNRSSRHPASPPPQNPAFGFPTSRDDGLDDNLINMIKTYQYQAGGGLALDGTDCSVCLSPFADGDGIRLLPKCGHAFHQCCIDTWLKSHSNCPLCRACIFPLQEVPELEPEPEPEPDMARVVRIGENSEIIEIGEGRGVIGRSFSMDSPFRRPMNADTVTHTDSTGWCRSLHSVISPIRMKRSRSLRIPTGRERRAILPA